MRESPELALLLACARAAPSAEDDERIRGLVADRPDWIRLLRHGGRHGVLPIVYDRLRELDPGEGSASAVPAAVLEALRNRYYATGRANLRLTQRLTELAGLLEARGVPVVALKGPVLAATIYPSLTSREFGDLDLLVRRDDLDGARAALAEAGLEPLDELGEGQDAAFRAVWYAYCWRDPATDTLVELHWRLAPLYFPMAIDARRMWEETEEVTVHDRPLRSFRPEMLLLTLCAHGAKHEPDAWPRLKWIRDVAEVTIARPDLDWDRLHELSARAGCSRILHVGLRLAARLCGARIPPPELRRVEADAGAVAIADRLEKRLFAESSESTPLDRIRFELRIRERLRDRVRVLVRRALVPDTKDLAAVRLPRPLAPLYVPLRLARLLVRTLMRPGRLRNLRRPMERKAPVVRV